MQAKINVLIYALPNTTGGGYSVVLNLYEDLKLHGELYPNIHWHFIMGVDRLKSTNNITIVNDSWALKTWIHRCIYNRFIIPKYIRDHEIVAMISLNMGISGVRVPSIISLHNVLPLYKCDECVFDSRKDILKQMLINRLIKKSLKEAEYIVVPSTWIKNELINRFVINNQKIYVSPISVPEFNMFLQDRNNINYCYAGKKVFVYPAAVFPYKNHKVIVEATKFLIQQGINNFTVIFSGIIKEGKTINIIRKEIGKRNLPIEIRGVISKKELAMLYTHGVLIFPSKIETDAFPLLESMGCGGRILAANIAYAIEALHGYNNYDLFNPDSAIELSKKMQDEITNTKHSLGKRFLKGNARSGVFVPLVEEIAQRRGKRNEM